MLQFNIRRMFATMSIASALVAAWLTHPLLGAVLFVMTSSVVACFAYRNAGLPRRFRWMGAAFGAAVAMLACVLLEYYRPSSGDAAIGLTRAIPMSLVFSLALGSLVSLLVHAADYLRARFRKRPFSADALP